MTRAVGVALALVTLVAGCGTARLAHPPVAVVAEGRAPVHLDHDLVVTELSLRDRAGAWRATPVLLDLGSALPLTLTTEVAAWADVTWSGATRTFRNARGDALTARRGEVAGAAFAGLEATALPVTESVWAPDYAPPVPLGHLGWPFLAERRVTLDLGAGELRQAPSRPGPCAGVPLAAGGAGLTVRVSISGREVTAILDTAAQATIVTDPTLAGEGPITLVGGPTVDAGPRVHVSEAQLPERVLLGAPFFARQVVTIDVPAGCLEVRPTGGL